VDLSKHVQPDVAVRCVICILRCQSLAELGCMFLCLRGGEHKCGHRFQVLFWGSLWAGRSVFVGGVALMSPAAVIALTSTGQSCALCKPAHHRVCCLHVGRRRCNRQHARRQCSIACLVCAHEVRSLLHSAMGAQRDDACSFGWHAGCQQ